MIPVAAYLAAGALVIGAAGVLLWTYSEGKDAGAAIAHADFARAQDIALKARDAEQARIIKEQQDAAIRAAR